MIREKPNIFFADELGLTGTAFLKKKFKVFSVEGLSNEKLLRSIGMKSQKDKRGVLIIRSTRKLSAEFLNVIRDKTYVRLICTVSSGFDNIDIAAAKKLGIDVLNVPDGNIISAAEFTIALILSVSKGIVNADKDMKSGIFKNAASGNFELYGKTIGIIGVGRVGSYTAKLARAFGMNVLGNDIRKDLARKYKFIRFVSLKKLLLASDIVTIHIPLDSSTKNLVNSKNIALLKRNSVLINCSRGGTIDEKALIERLKQRKLYYAAVDVFTNEPAFRKEFRSLPNVLLTPHIAGKTKESKERMSVIAAENIIKYILKGRTSVKLVN